MSGYRVTKLLVRAMAVVASMPLVAETVNGIEWDFRIFNDNGRSSAEIYHADGYNSFYTPSAAIPTNTTGHVVIPSSLGGYPVTKIGQRAFSGCNNITSVMIPDCIRIVGCNAFEGCSGLTHVSIPNSVTTIEGLAFLDCSSLTSVTLGNNVSSIHDKVFSGCSGLKNITIPESVTSIGNKVFYGCTNITSVTIPQSVCDCGIRKVFSPDGYANCVSITNVVVTRGATNICYEAFAGCTGLENVAIPNTVEVIGEYAFRDCRSLCRITIPNSVVSIGDFAFVDCRRLTGIAIPDSVKNVGRSAFGGCSGLTSVTIPNTVTNIGNWAFSGCSSLTDVTIPKNLTDIGDSLFRGCRGLADEDGFVIVWNKLYGYFGTGGDIVIPNDVESIEYGAFEYNAGLKSVRMPDTVTHIGERAFYQCREMTNITLSAYVKDIGNSAFFECRSLPSLIIPNSVANIGGWVFDYCYSLKNLTIPGRFKGNLENNNFNGCNADLLINYVYTYFTITFDANGGSVDEHQRSVREGDKVGELPIPTMPNYLFIGWYSSATGGEKITSSNIVAQPLTYYARWSPECVVVDSTEKSVKELYPNDYETIANIVVSDSIAVIPSGFFQGCSGLRGVTIPETITTIGDGAFKGCSSLTSVTIPDSVTSIGSGAFSGCGGLEAIQIPFVGARRGNSEESYGAALFGYIFGSTSYSGGKKVRQATSPGWACEFYIPSGLKKIVITDETVLGYGAFSSCSDLTNVTIASSCVRIAEAAFKDCSGLCSILFEGNAPNIEVFAFSGSNTGCLVRIPWESTGWNVSIPGTWQGMLIDYAIPVVLFNANGGSVSAPAMQTHEGVVTGEIPVPVREGYSFSGWFLDDGNGDEIHLGMKIDGSIRVGAHWTCNKYKVTFETNGGSGGVASEQDYASEIVPPEVTRDGYSLIGWLPEVDTIVPASNVTYKAQWKIDQRVVTSDTNDYDFNTSPSAEWIGDNSISHDGNKSLRSGEVENNESTWLEATVNGAGRLSFWWKASSEEYEGEIYDYAYLSIDGVAHGTLNGDKLSGIAIGGKTDWTNVVLDVVGDGPHTIRWTYYKDGSDECDIGDDCVWLDEFSFRSKVSVSFDTVNGDGATPYAIITLQDEVVSLPTGEGLSLTDYAFSGWTDGVREYAAGADYTVPASNVTLTAVWIAKRFLSFILDGGEGEIPVTIKDVPNATVTLPSADGINKPKYHFVGWSDGTQTYEAGAEYVVTDSGVEFTAVWAANTLDAPVITSADVVNGGMIETASATIEIVATDGAAIYYTIDGTEPTTNSVLYAGAFSVDGLTPTIRAVAVKDNYFDSPVAEFSFTRKPYSAAECLNVAGKVVSTGGEDATWVRVLGAVAHDGVAALRSGAIGDGGSSSVEMSVDGAGEIGFWWKTSCETAAKNKQRDFVAFFLDGTEQCWMGGITDWSNKVFTVSGDGAHTLKWVYRKNDNGTTEGDDCAWLDEVTWTPWREITTKQTAVPIPYGWFESHGLLSGDSNPEAVAMQTTGKRDGSGRHLTIMDDFIAGTDPSDESDVFNVTISISNGLPVVEWHPNLNTNGANRVYTIYGKETLDDEWVTPTNSLSHFFKVDVAMPPTGDGGDTAGGGSTGGDDEPSGGESGESGNVIPAGYSTNNVQFVSCTGSEWYDLGLPPTLTMKTQIKCSFAGENEHMAIIGVVQPTTQWNVDEYRLFIAATPFEWFLDLPGPSRIHGTSVELNEVREVEFGNFYVKDMATDTVLLSGGTVTKACPQNNIRLFRTNYSYPNRYTTGSVYYVKIYDLNASNEYEPVRNLVPCKPDNGDAGLLDLVEMKFYKNDGTSVQLTN